MPREYAFTPPWYAWLAGGAAAVAVLLVHPPQQLVGYRMAIGLALLVASIGVVYVLWHLDAAYGFTAALALSVFSGNWNALGLPGFPFVPDRLLLLVVLVAVVLRAPAAWDRPRFAFRGEHALLAITLLYVVCSAAIAGTLGNRNAIFAFLDQLGVVPFAAFLLAPLVFRTSAQRNVLLGLLLGLGTYLGLTAVFEVLGPRALVFPHYISDPFYGIHHGRARGPFAEAVTNGFALFACGVAAAIVHARWPSPGMRRWAAFVMPLCAAGCLLTLERGVWLATVAGLVAGMLTQRSLRRRLPLVLVGGALAVGAAYVFVPGLADRADQRAGAKLPVWDRQNQAAAALRMLADRPVLGFGWNTFQRESGPYFVQSRDYPLTGAHTALHNVYLLNAVELGLLGTTLWLAAMVVCIGGAIVRRGPPGLADWRSGLVAISVFWVVITLVNPLQQSFSQLLLWTWAGIVASGTLYARKAASPAALREIAAA
ncbi:MAG TPA: O-antigen ligase family protein [Conexibacter sp.]|nr:O-antigen ligase family protein [Conexibacter sp.]